MVVSTPERTRKHLLGKYPLVPYADDGPLASAVCKRIQAEMSCILLVGDDGEPELGALNEVDKRRPKWALELRNARYLDQLKR